MCVTRAEDKFSIEFVFTSRCAFIVIWSLWVRHRRKTVYVRSICCVQALRVAGAASVMYCICDFISSIARYKYASASECVIDILKGIARDCVREDEVSQFCEGSGERRYAYMVPLCTIAPRLVNPRTSTCIVLTATSYPIVNWGALKCFTISESARACVE